MLKFVQPQIWTVAVTFRFPSLFGPCDIIIMIYGIYCVCVCARVRACVLPENMLHGLPVSTCTEGFQTFCMVRTPNLRSENEESKCGKVGGMEWRKWCHGLGALPSRFKRESRPSPRVVPTPPKIWVQPLECCCCPICIGTNSFQFAYRAGHSTETELRHVLDSTQA